MNERSFERRAQAWLELGPTKAPPEAVQSVFAAIDTVPQERSRLRLLGRQAPIAWQGRLAFAAAVALAVVALGAVALRDRPADVAATPSPKDPTSLLKDFGPATVRFEKSGGPTTAAGRVEIGSVELAGSSVVGLSCTGAASDDLFVELVTPAQKEPWLRAGGLCDGKTYYEQLRGEQPAGPMAVWVTAPSGVTWQVAFGEYSPSFAATPSFAPVAFNPAWKLMSDLEPMLVSPGGGLGVAIAIPPEATLLAVSLQCEGAGSLTILVGQVPSGAPSPCEGKDKTHRVEIPVEGGLQSDVSVRADGLAWIHIVVEANTDPITTWPSAPPMPPDVAATGYADADRQFIALGTLGSRTQTMIRLDGSTVGMVGGDHVGVATQDGSGWRLDLWSISTASVVQTLAQVPAPDGLYGSVVDATHEHVYYAIYTPLGSSEWHRVAFDGTGDTVVATEEAGGQLRAQLAVDDSVFVVDACQAGKGCRRQIVDAATGQTRTVQLTGDLTCQMLGVADGQIVAVSAPTCSGSESFRITAMPLDGGERRVLTEEPADGVVIATSAGTQLVYGTPPTEQSQGSVRTIVLATGESRELISLTGDNDPPSYPTKIRLPDDWILLAWQLGDFPSQGVVLRAIPVLINVVTGERIELVNLPHHLL